MESCPKTANSLYGLAIELKSLCLAPAESAIFELNLVVYVAEYVWIDESSVGTEALARLDNNKTLMVDVGLRVWA